MSEDHYIFGVDPDSEKHGVAIYKNGNLIDLRVLSLVEIVQALNNLALVTFAIEDVKANNFVYARNRKASKAAQSKVGLSIGRCQQSQVELMRWLDHLEIPYKLYKPQKGNWAELKGQFERLTGWTGRSNKDTRSAAFFGYKLKLGMAA